MGDSDNTGRSEGGAGEEDGRTDYEGSDYEDSEWDSEDEGEGMEVTAATQEGQESVSGIWCPSHMGCGALGVIGG
jgi:hypothetical protein